MKVPLFFSMFCVLPHKKLVVFLVFIEFFLQSVAHRNTFDETGSLPKCYKFSDHRKAHHGENYVGIPDRHTSLGIYASKSNKKVRYYLTQQAYIRCPEEKVKEISVEWDYSGLKNHAIPRDFNSVKGATGDAPQTSYFTASGYFYEWKTRAFYKPNGEYCISSVHDNKIKLRVCAVRNNCETAPNQKTYCLPKCCPVDEVLSVPSKKCIPEVELPEPGNHQQYSVVKSGITPWVPPLYSQYQDSKTPIPWSVDITQHWVTGKKETSFVTSNVTFQMAQLPKSCNSGWFGQPRLKYWTDKKADSKTFRSNDTVRLGIPYGGESGQILPMLYNKKNRTWVKQKTVDFCVEGFFEEEDGSHQNYYTGNDYNYVVFYCNQENRGTTLASCATPEFLFIIATLVTYLLKQLKN